MCVCLHRIFLEGSIKPVTDCFLGEELGGYGVWEGDFSLYIVYPFHLFELLITIKNNIKYILPLSELPNSPNMQISAQFDWSWVDMGSLKKRILSLPCVFYFPLVS